MYDNKFPELGASVSVVIPCYRCSDSIGRAVASVAAQTLRPLEVILVDDASGDGTCDTLRSLQRAYPEGWIQLVFHELNKGPGAARNSGWNVSQGRYVAFLDADDTWHPEKLAVQYQWMEQNPGVVMTGHDCPLYGENPEDECGTSATFQVISPQMLLWSNVIFTPSVVVRRDIQDRFDPAKRYSEDYLLWLMIAFRRGKVARSKQPLAFLHKAPYGAAGLSSHLWRMQRGELHTYSTLYKSSMIGFSALCLLQAWSLMKFLRRITLLSLASSRTRRTT